ncbi:AfsR/SARP family transcriptional regulator [Protofrankia symbiont of Coriaria ruscifolia]|uniref:AfsR/SARP family transcriptional regulator n=1 Tax=Protofrankia symbiont of Coriaria ruscifolia TaxID=1306542 RepID=UPI0010418F7E|nr:AfsR/SARP family transcriptional regulator [Protofrankia symbiont of Coriaria ruscifolia]
MDIRLLGPLEADERGVSLIPTARKPRQLLALLVLNLDQVVSVDACVEELWDDEPPTSMAATLQTYILQIRRRLAKLPRLGSLQAARTVLETRGNGYVFRTTTDDEYDVLRFEQNVQAARVALARDDSLTGACLLRDALELWRGPALAGTPAGPLVRARLVGLEESRLTALEQRIEADLRLGRHHELLGELTSLVAGHPVLENLHAQLMLALYRSGRPAQALGVYDRLRGSLDRELGIEPSQRLRRLHRAVLSADPALDPPHPATFPLSLGLV